MSTSTPIQNLKINKLTQAQFDTSSKASTELWFVTDALDAQYEIMPIASAQYEGGITQYIGVTSSTYINGYFYKCVSDGQSPATYSWTQVDVQSSLTAGNNIQINNNVISATDTTYTAGTGISISASNVISSTQTSASWGNITGTLSNQTDLQTALNAKQNSIDSSNKLSSDLVDDTNATNKFVTAADKTTWNNKLSTSSTANILYATDSSGQQTTITYANTVIASTAAVRSATGTLSVATPTSNDHATTKQYVDTNKSAVEFVEW